MPVEESKVAAILVPIVAQVVIAGLCGCGVTIQNLSSANIAGSLVVSAQAVDFGSVPIGQTENSTISVSNTAPDSIQIEQIQLQGAPFSVTGQNSAPISIAAGQSYSLGLSFHPTSAGATTGALILTSSLSPGNPITVTLSGNGELVAHAGPTLSGLTCAKSSMTLPGQDTCRVTLTAPAGSGGVTVGLSSNSTAVRVPAHVRVVSGEASDTFMASVSTVSAIQSVHLTASAGGFTKSYTIDIGNAIRAGVLSGLTCAKGSMVGSGKDICTVTLTAPANSGGLTVALSSSSGTITVPNSADVLAGTSSRSFSADVSRFEKSQTVQLTASVAGVVKHYSIQLKSSTVQALDGLSCESVRMKKAGTDICTVTLAGAAGSGGLTVRLASSSPVISVPTSVTVQDGATSARFNSTVSTVIRAETVKLTASASGITESYSIDLGNSTTPGVLSGLTCGKGPTSGAGKDTCTVTLTAPAGSDGLTIGLWSSNVAVTVPSSVNMLAGTTSETFTAKVSTVTKAATVTLTASAGGKTESYVIQLGAATPSLKLQSTSVAFGDVSLNTPVTQTVLLTSSGTAALTISTATATGAGFSRTGPDFPVTLQPGQTTTLDIQFDPTVQGAASGKVALMTNTSAGTAMIALSGTGQAANSYEVDLTWDAPTDSAEPVAGYDIYRAVSGTSSYQLLNSSTDGSTTYTDTKVQSGTSYQYYVVSVAASGSHSAPSNLFNVTIP